MQRRANTGKEFEEEIAKKYGKRLSKSPKIKWTGEGRNNFDKIVSLNFNEKLFYPTENSIFFKCDLVDNNGKFHEIKKYFEKETRNNWKLYSEPIIKVSTKSTLDAVIKKFGNGDFQVAQRKYNEFVGKLFIELQNNGTLDKMLKEMTQNTLGMYLKDCYVTIDKIEFRWTIVESAWKGFNRITLEFKLK